MSDSNSEENQTPAFETPPVDNAVSEGKENNASERFTEVMGTINQTLGKIDWSQMGNMGKLLELSLL